MAYHLVQIKPIGTPAVLTGHRCLCLLRTLPWTSQPTEMVSPGRWHRLVPIFKAGILFTTVKGKWQRRRWFTPNNPKRNDRLLRAKYRTLRIPAWRGHHTEDGSQEVSKQINLKLLQYEVLIWQHRREGKITLT